MIKYNYNNNICIQNITRHSSSSSTEQELHFTTTRQNNLINNKNSICRGKRHTLDKGTNNSDDFLSSHPHHPNQPHKFWSETILFRRLINEFLVRGSLKVVVPPRQIIRWRTVWVWRIVIEVRCIYDTLHIWHDWRSQGATSQTVPIKSVEPPEIKSS